MGFFNNKKIKLNREEILKLVLEEKNGDKIKIINNYCVVRNQNFDSDIEKINFYVDEYEKSQKTWKETFEIAEVMSDELKMENARILASINNNLGESVDMAKVYVTASKNKNVMKRISEIKNWLEEPETLKRCSVYCQITKKEFDNDFSMINYVIDEKENSSKLFERNIEIINVMENSEKMGIAALLAKLDGCQINNPAKLASIYLETKNKDEKNLKLQE